MMNRIVLLIIACAFLFGGGRCLQCYFCNDDSEKGNCEGIKWSILKDCVDSCVTFQAIGQPKRHYLMYNLTRYRRGCGDKTGCAGIKKNYEETFKKVHEFDCQECKSDLCNNRANHPGHKFG